jgi:hypothetical protein
MNAMKLVPLLLAAALAGGCSHARIDASVGTGASNVPPPAGTSVTSGSAGLHIQSHSLAAVVIAGMFMAAAIDHSREERSFPSFSSFADWFRGTPAPGLHPDRPISEQDCTKPVEFTGNLKCR